jgi:predicted transcriptional regulator of viral defense system
VQQGVRIYRAHLPKQIRNQMTTFSKKRIAASFEESDLKIWSKSELFEFIAENLDEWKTRRANPDRIVVHSPTQTKILNALLKETQLEAIQLAFPYRSVTRYVWGAASTQVIIQSVDHNGYFSHYTAMQWHGLTEQIPKAIYFNVEQPATGGGGALTQVGIDRAFKGKCRTSTNIIEFRDIKIHKLNGQNTEKLGVELSSAEAGISQYVTNLERTLIDIAVRPVYSGGITEVAAAYKAAAEQVSINRLTTYLRSLNYTYPYHQAIGYYMERAGNYSEAKIGRLLALPRDFDFYITYQIKNPEYNKKWRLYVPQGF